MSRGLLFWVLMILWLVFSLYRDWPSTPGPRGFAPLGGGLLLFILIALLGWSVFGPVLR